MATSAINFALGTKENPITTGSGEVPTRNEEGDVQKSLPQLLSVRAEEESEVEVGVPVEIAVAQFTVQILTDVLNALSSVERKIAIAIKNYSGYDLEDPDVYFSSGSSPYIPSHQIHGQIASTWGAQKTSGPVARGTVGTMSYFIPGQNKTLLFMWSVPFDYNLYSNWWNSTIVSGNVRASENIFNDLYYGKNGLPYPFRAGGSWKERSDDNVFKVLGYMTDVGISTIELELTTK